MKRLVWLFFLSINILHAQNIDGLWVVQTVIVGNHQMTPQAKWIQFDRVGRYTSGNGWLQNDEGSYTIEGEHGLSMRTENGIIDEYGSFKVSLFQDKMEWRREEEGQPVIVKLSKALQIPKGPADKISGLWQLQSKEDLSKWGFPNACLIHIRWDRIYSIRDGGNVISHGIWQMHGHRPEVVFHSNNQESNKPRWSVSFNDETMTLEGVSEDVKEIQIHFLRRKSF